MAKQNFQLLVCQRFHCPPSEYEEKVFRKCLYWHARLLAPVVRKLRRDFFMEDFKFIRYLGDSTGLREINADLMNYRDANLGNPSIWRTGLKIRVSGRKARRLAQLLFAAERGANLQPIGNATSPSNGQRRRASRTT